jgi:spermidine synthase
VSGQTLTNLFGKTFMKKLSRIKIAVFFLFLLSGMCGLIFEVVWSKYLYIFIGSTAYSHLMVLATYLGGLAIGAFIFGKYSDKVLNQLKLYGLLEVGIGVYCLAYPFIIEEVGKFFILTATAFDGSSQQGVLLILKFILSIITLLLPTVLMGGTLPVLVRFLSKSISESGKDVAKLYYINCLGAVIGAGLAGFFLIRMLGLDNTVWIASFLNILIGILALLFAKSVNPKAQLVKTPIQKEDTQSQVYPENVIRIAIFTAFVTGFAALLYQLAWIRLLSNILGSTTYSFTLMLVAFISGIAIGSFIVSLVINKIKNLVAFLALCQYGTAITMIFTLPLYERLPFYLLKISEMIPNQPENFPSFLGLQFLFCFMIMLVPTILSGMSLPIISRIANRDMQILGKSIGGVFSVNTIGSVVGVMITGLILIPALGVKRTIEIGVLLNGLLGLFILFKTGFSPRLKIGLSLTMFVIAVGYHILVPAWNQNIFISGVFRTIYKLDAKSYSEFKKQQNEGQNILWYKEGINANVAIRESKFGDIIQKTLVINGKADASSVADLNTQILLGHIPLLLTPNTGDALVIGLGSGITCGSALTHPIKSLDVVEIASEVVECNYFFTQENNNFMADPRVKIYIDDAFTYLKTSKKDYDYIISEPSNPWIAGIGNLYSVEFFRLCKERLRTNGVLTQWFHTYDMNNDVFNLVMRTLSEVFPYVSVWKATHADIIILASASPLEIDFEAMKLCMNQTRVAQDLSRIKMNDVPTLLSTQIVSARNNTYSLVKNEFNTVKKPLLEFLAPVALFTHESVTVLDSLDERFTFMDKNLWFWEYEKQYPLSLENYLNIARYRSASQVGDLALAYTALRKALEIAPNNEAALRMLKEISGSLRLPDTEMRMSQLEELRMMYEFNPTDFSTLFRYLNSLVEYYQIENSVINPQQMDDAVGLMKQAIKITNGREEQFHYILAMILSGAGRSAEAAEVFKGLLRFQNPDGTGFSILGQNELIYNIVESYYNAGDLEEAENYLGLYKSKGGDDKYYKLMQRKISMKKLGHK